MAVPETTGVKDCEIVPVTSNRDGRGRLYEIYMRSWPRSFATVQWNASTSSAGVAHLIHFKTDPVLVSRIRDPGAPSGAGT